MKTRTKEGLALILSAVVLVCILVLATLVTEPKRLNYGATWGMFLEEPKNSIDVMYFGSSLVYCDVVPAVIYEQTGLTSYVMAGPEQTIPMCYYYLRQALKTQSPQAIFVEITGLFYSRYTNYTKVNIGNMPLGTARLAATFEEAEPDLRGGLLFPLAFYHDRWSQLTKEDFSLALGGYQPDPLAGYTFLSTYCPTEGVYIRDLSLDEGTYERNLSYLEKIRLLCAEKGIQAVFYVAPGLGRFAHMERAVETLSKTVTVLDCNGRYDEIGIDEARDYHDTLHFNAAGADKFSLWLSSWIADNLSVTVSPPKDAALWQQRLDCWSDCLAQPLQPKETF